ncbi:MAG: ribonuclease HII [Pseudomonadota bacterium]|nr:ribonuclease HII [Pseudomonadota bacterium]
MPDFSFESSHGGIVAGVDEAGRGPWAGPVVAAAVILDPARLPDGVDDSKKVPAAKREMLYGLILASARTGVGMASAQEIDALNILQATMLAMQRAVASLGGLPDVALVDGNRAPKLPCPAQMIVGGDALCLSIAAASIIAKVTRDRIMQDLAEEFPYYGWETNAGYGTSAHQNGLREYGVTPHHRRSFAPIRALLQTAEMA